MNILRLCIPLLVSLFHLGAWITLFSFEQFFFAILILLLVGTDIFLSLMIPRTVEKRKVFLASFPALFLTCASLFLVLFVEHESFKWLIAGVDSIAQALFFSFLFLFLYRPSAVHDRLFEHQGVALTVLGMFTSTAGLFALIAFLDVRMIFLFPLFVGIPFLVAWYHLLCLGLPLRGHWWFVLVPACIVGELTLVFRWLPNLYFVGAFVLTVFFFTTVSLCASSLRKEITRKEVLAHVLLSVFMIVLVLITTLWQ